MIWLAAAYLGVGFLAALMVTTEEGIALLRAEPDWRTLESDHGGDAFLLALLLGALLIIVTWPLAFVIGKDDA